VTAIVRTPLRVLVAGATAGPDDGTPGALADALVAHLRRRGHDAESIALPLGAGHTRRLNDACAWRLLNLSSSNACRIDLVIATAFPAWSVRHPRKVAWIANEDALAPDDWNDGGAGSDADAERRQRLVQLDTRALIECSRVFAGGVLIAERLKRWSGIEASLLAPPPRGADHAAGERAGAQYGVWDSIIEQLLG
jgi:hypothetical protein